MQKNVSNAVIALIFSWAIVVSVVVAAGCSPLSSSQFEVCDDIEQSPAYVAYVSGDLDGAYDALKKSSCERSDLNFIGAVYLAMRMSGNSRLTESDVSEWLERAEAQNLAGGVFVETVYVLAASRRYDELESVMLQNARLVKSRGELERARIIVAKRAIAENWPPNKLVSELVSVTASHAEDLECSG